MTNCFSVTTLFIFEVIASLESQTTCVHKIKAYPLYGTGLLHIKSKETVLESKTTINSCSNDTNCNTSDLPKFPSKRI